MQHFVIWVFCNTGYYVFFNFVCLPVCSPFSLHLKVCHIIFYFSFLWCVYEWGCRTGFCVIYGGVPSFMELSSTFISMFDKIMENWVRQRKFGILYTKLEADNSHQRVVAKSYQSLVIYACNLCIRVVLTLNTCWETWDKSFRCHQS